jgi:hypothetical protein
MVSPGWFQSASRGRRQSLSGRRRLCNPGHAGRHANLLRRLPKQASGPQPVHRGCTASCNQGSGAVAMVSVRRQNRLRGAFAPRVCSAAHSSRSLSSPAIPCWPETKIALKRLLSIPLRRLLRLIGEQGRGDTIEPRGRLPCTIFPALIAMDFTSLRHIGIKELDVVFVSAPGYRVLQCS